MRERVEAMKAIWTEDEASYHGEFVDFDRIWSWPKPLQRPHPPILVGGNGPTVLDRVLDYGDAWMPNHGAERHASAIAELRERADRPSRSRSSMRRRRWTPAVLAELRGGGRRPRRCSGCRRPTRGASRRSWTRFERVMAELRGRPGC